MTPLLSGPPQASNRIRRKNSAHFSLDPVANPLDTFLLALGTVCPLIFVGFVFFDRRRICAAWAKLIAIIAALGGFVWGGPPMGVVAVTTLSSHTRSVLPACRPPRYRCWPSHWLDP